MLRTQNMYMTSNPQVSNVLSWLGQSENVGRNKGRRLTWKLVILGSIFTTVLRYQRLFFGVVSFIFLCFDGSTRSHSHSSLTTELLNFVLKPVLPKKWPFQTYSSYILGTHACPASFMTAGARLCHNPRKPRVIVLGSTEAARSHLFTVSRASAWYW